MVTGSDPTVIVYTLTEGCNKIFDQINVLQFKYSHDGMYPRRRCEFERYNFWCGNNYGKKIIIGFLDTRYPPESVLLLQKLPKDFHAKHQPKMPIFPTDSSNPIDVQ